MKLTIKTLKQDVFHVETEPSTTIGELKNLIKESQGFEPSAQKLIFSGKILDDGKSIEEYSIQEKDFLVVMVSKPKVKGGASTTSAAKKSTTTAAAAEKKVEAAKEPSPVAAAPSPAAPAAPAAPQGTPAETPSTGTTEGGADNLLSKGDQYNEAVTNLVSFGFDIETVKKAMRAAFNNPDRAAEYLFNGIPAGLASEATPAAAAPTDTSATTEAATETGATTTTTTTTDSTTVTPAAGAEQPRYVNLFDEAETAATTTTGAEGAAGEQNPLSFLQGGPQMDQLRPLLQENPQLLQSLLEQLGMNNPQIMQGINEHPEEFLSMLSQSLGAEGGDFDGMDEDGDAAMGGDAQFVSITPEDDAAIQRLMDLGFERGRAMEAYIACDKNEELAANFLFDHGNNDF